MAIVRRDGNNPILTPADVPYEVATVHNAAAAVFGDEICMVFRSHLHNGRSILGLATSSDGVNFRCAEKPFMIPSTETGFAEYEEYGVEDPRITFIDNYYYITYSAYSRHGVRIGLARTADFQKVERVAFITEADHRNVVLFPEKINGMYVRFDRPHTDITPWSIWISWSPDLIHWGRSERVFGPEMYHWTEMKIGPGAPPVKTSEGWLNIFHGVYPTMDGAVYRLGVALHELNDPSRLVGICDNWILQPEAEWELTGYVHNVVFSCAAIDEGNDTLRIYWGGADKVMCTGTASISELIDLCKTKNRKGAF